MVYEIIREKIREGYHQRVRQALNSLEIMASHIPQSLENFAKRLGEYYELRKEAKSILTEEEMKEMIEYDKEMEKYFDIFTVRRIKQIEGEKK